MKTYAMILTAALIAAPATLAGSAALNDASEYGHCTAYENSEMGREHGNATFDGLEENATAANATVEEYCEDVAHPSENANASAAADEHRPEDPGAAADEHRPDDAGQPDDAGDDEDASEEHRRDDDHRRDDEDHGPP